MKARFPKFFTVFIFLGLVFIPFLMKGEALSAEDQQSASPSGEAKGALSAEELNRQLNNPVSSVWSMVFQNNYTQLKSGSQDMPGWKEGDDKWFYNLKESAPEGRGFASGPP